MIFMQKQSLNPICLPAVYPQPQLTPIQKFKLKYRRQVSAFRRSLDRHKSVFLPLLTALFFIQLNNVRALAQTANGFGEAIGKVKNHSIVSGAGPAAGDVVTFPFLMVGVLILLAILGLAIVGISALYTGRDIAGPILNLAGAFTILLMVSAMLLWISSSGLLDGASTAGAGG